MFFNVFSGKTYIRTGSLMIDSDGKTFTRVGNNFYSEDGQIIRQTGDVYENLHTGIRSTFGDPFDGGNDADRIL